MLTDLVDPQNESPPTAGAAADAPMPSGQRRGRRRPTSEFPIVAEEQQLLAIVLRKLDGGRARARAARPSTTPARSSSCATSWPRRSPRTRARSSSRCTASRRCRASAARATARPSIASRPTSGTCASRRAASGATCSSARAATSSRAAACRSSTGATPPSRASSTATRRATPTRSASATASSRARCSRGAPSPSSTPSCGAWPRRRARSAATSRPAPGAQVATQQAKLQIARDGSAATMIPTRRRARRRRKPPPSAVRGRLGLDESGQRAPRSPPARDRGAHRSAPVRAHHAPGLGPHRRAGLGGQRQDDNRPAPHRLPRLRRPAPLPPREDAHHRVPARARGLRLARAAGARRRGRALHDLRGVGHRDAQDGAAAARGARHRRDAVRSSCARSRTARC